MKKKKNNKDKDKKEKKGKKISSSEYKSEPHKDYRSFITPEEYTEKDSEIRESEDFDEDNSDEEE